MQSRLYERNIDIDHIKRTIKSPDEKYVDHEGIKVRKKIGKKTLTVVYSSEKWRDQPDTYIIITAYYLGK